MLAFAAFVVCLALAEILPIWISVTLLVVLLAMVTR